MRYALPITDGKVSPHFGHCERFALIDVDEAARTIVNKELVIPPDHQPGVFPAWLAEEGVNIVIAGGMGIRAQNLFIENRIEVVVGAVGDDPEEIVLAHLSGTLVTGDNVCDH
jgi:ATP-binding protein involved in chromosome partitioning